MAEDRSHLELTAGVVRAAHYLRLGDLSAAQREVVERLFVDGCGVMLAGLEHPTSRRLAEHVEALGCRGVARVPGSTIETAPQEAALLIGAATHVLDFEPMFSPPTHAVSPVLGAVMALSCGEGAVGVSGERLLEAFAAGIVLQAGLRCASAERREVHRSAAGRHFPFHAQGFHLPGILGVLGSALSASLLLELDESATAMAIGMAASRASGIAANIGTMTKALHCGNAARAGVECALLARRGFTASDRALEAPSGWAQVFGGAGLDQERVLAELRDPRCLVSPGFAFKRWPAHSAMQIAIAAALPLHDPSGPPRGHVRVTAPALPYCDRPTPRDTDEARFSFQLNVAQALLDGEVTSRSFERDRLERRELRELLSRVELTLCDSIPRDFSRSEVRIELEDGRRASSDRWPGHWKSPAQDDQLRAKFVECASPRMDPTTAAALHDRLRSISAEPVAREALRIP